jgi:hypothetical protein
MQSLNEVNTLRRTYIILTLILTVVLVYLHVELTLSSTAQ